ncbi:MAG TPA: excalibur calcium-binding domain-containing protein [Pseudonocardiaceae bacterium]|nr:excalibur calcium-binding domain-containing protein [Pseudonocardiaceae bacterium]
MLAFRAALAAVSVPVAAAALLVGISGTALAAQNLNCDDFTYQEDAQAVYDANPSDPHGLDGDDNDGLACESLPRRPVQQPPATTEPPVPSPPATTESPAPAPTAITEPPAPAPVPATPGDRDCADFASQPEAQAVLDADSADRERLDADNDGLACEALFGGNDPAAPQQQTSDQQVEIYPLGGVDTGDPTMASRPGSGVLGGLAAGLIAVAALLGLRRAQRG